MHHNISLKINVVLASEFESVYCDENPTWKDTTWNEAFEKAIETKEAINEIESLVADECEKAGTLVEKIKAILEKLK